MIVKRYWTTYKKFGATKLWRGWFLLGFIPIYIEHINGVD